MLRLLGRWLRIRGSCSWTNPSLRWTRSHANRLYTDIQQIWEQRKKTIIFVTHNVREAACLGDRVLVFSRHPGRIIEEFVIGLQRPRDINSVDLANYTSVIIRALKGTLGFESRGKPLGQMEVAALSS